MNPTAYNKRRIEIQQRISGAQGYLLCIVGDCKQPTMAHQRSGLNRNYCRRHVDHYKRHGSYAKPSYSAAQLNPYRKSALRWLQARRGETCVIEALDRVGTAYWRAGRPVAAFRLAGLSPRDRANALWARLSERKVDSLHLLAVWLGVTLCHRADTQPERKVTYRTVQAGKVIHRLSGGTHKRWETSVGDGIEVTELHKYPPSRGAVLRHVGATIAWAALPLMGNVEILEAFHALQAQTSKRLPRARSRATACGTGTPHPSS